MDNRGVANRRTHLVLPGMCVCEPQTMPRGFDHSVGHPIGLCVGLQSLQARGIGRFRAPAISHMAQSGRCRDQGQGITR